jgi:hypothetical protein
VTEDRMNDMQLLFARDQIMAMIRPGYVRMSLLMGAAATQEALLRGEDIKKLQKMIDRSGFDVSPCQICNEDVVCIPDGLPMCESCAQKENQ